jgi:hypothetical protein
MQDELCRLRDDNRTLREHNDELNAQLLQASIDAGRSLLNDHGTSLAQELHGKDKDEVGVTAVTIVIHFFPAHPSIARARDCQPETAHLHRGDTVESDRETSGDAGSWPAQQQ